MPQDTILHDRYRIVGCIGVGGFGITYLCEDLQQLTNVAVKEYFPSQWVERDETYVSVKKAGFQKAFEYGLRSFENEINITAKFRKSEGVITLYDAFMENDTIYMVMEYLHGISLGKTMKQREGRPYSLKEAMEIMNPVLDALDRIHQRGIIHCDISPANIILMEDGQVQIIDFGAAKDLRKAGVSLQAAFLKPDYAAPEQYQSARSGKAKGEGPWTDLYAFGATLTYLLTGQKPRDCVSRLNDENNSIFNTKLDTNMTPYCAIIEKATHLDRSQRYYQAPDIKKDLNNLL